MSKLPNTPARFFDGATGADGDIKRLLLDRANYYATTGGHGACRGCGEVTAIRLVMATSHALGDKRRTRAPARAGRADRAPAAKHATLVGDDAERRERIVTMLRALEKRLYLYEGGPTGNGPASPSSPTRPAAAASTPRPSRSTPTTTRG